jgi:hypothetical protein
MHVAGSIGPAAPERRDVVDDGARAADPTPSRARVLAAKFVPRHAWWGWTALFTQTHVTSGLRCLYAYIETFRKRRRHEHASQGFAMEAK